jgi:hypothetical protein
VSAASASGPSAVTSRPSEKRSSASAQHSHSFATAPRVGWRTHRSIAGVDRLAVAPQTCLAGTPFALEVGSSRVRAEQAPSSVEEAGRPGPAPAPVRVGYGLEDRDAALWSGSGRGSDRKVAQPSRREPVATPSLTNFTYAFLTIEVRFEAILLVSRAFCGF